MGAKVSCFGGFSTWPKEENYGNHQSLTSSAAISVANFLKPKCLWTEKKKNKEMQQKEKQEYNQQLTTTKEVTLEEWFLASPGTGDYRFCTKGGEFYAPKHFSNKIYPSLSADFTSKPRDTTSTISLERLLKMEEICPSDQEMGVISSISWSQSGKQKKRVTFKLPQESDIIIFHSPAIDCEDY